MNEQNSVQLESDNQKPDQSSGQSSEGLRKILNSLEEKTGDQPEHETGVSSHSDDQSAEMSPDDLPLPPFHDTNDSGSGRFFERKPEREKQDNAVVSFVTVNRIEPEKIISEAMMRLDKLLEEIKKNELSSGARDNDRL